MKRFSVSGSKGDGYYADVTWPRETRWRLHVRAGRTDGNFHALVYCNGEDTPEANAALLGAIREHAHLVEPLVSADAELDWEAHESEERATLAAIASCRWPHLGYESDPAEVAPKLARFGAGVAAAAKAAGL